MGDDDARAGAQRRDDVGPRASAGNLGVGHEEGRPAAGSAPADQHPRAGRVDAHDERVEARQRRAARARRARARGRIERDRDRDGGGVVRRVVGRDGRLRGGQRETNLPSRVRQRGLAQVGHPHAPARGSARQPGRGARDEIAKLAPRRRAQEGSPRRGRFPLEHDSPRGVVVVVRGAAAAPRTPREFRHEKTRGGRAVLPAKRDRGTHRHHRADGVETAFPRGRRRGVRRVRGLRHRTRRRPRLRRVLVQNLERRHLDHRAAAARAKPRGGDDATTERARVGKAEARDARPPGGVLESEETLGGVVGGWKSKATHQRERDHGRVAKRGRGSETSETSGFGSVSVAVGRVVGKRAAELARRGRQPARLRVCARTDGGGDVSEWSSARRRGAVVVAGRGRGRSDRGRGRTRERFAVKRGRRVSRRPVRGIVRIDAGHRDGASVAVAPPLRRLRLPRWRGRRGAKFQNYPRRVAEDESRVVRVQLRSTSPSPPNPVGRAQYRARRRRGRVCILVCILALAKTRAGPVRSFEPASQAAQGTASRRCQHLVGLGPAVPSRSVSRTRARRYDAGGARATDDHPSPGFRRRTALRHP